MLCCVLSPQSAAPSAMSHYCSVCGLKTHCLRSHYSSLISSLFSLRLFVSQHGFVLRRTLSLSSSTSTCSIYSFRPTSSCHLSSSTFPTSLLLSSLLSLLRLSFLSSSLFLLPPIFSLSSYCTPPLLLIVLLFLLLSSPFVNFLSSSSPTRVLLVFILLPF